MELRRENGKVIIVLEEMEARMLFQAIDAIDIAKLLGRIRELWGMERKVS